MVGWLRGICHVVVVALPRMRGRLYRLLLWAALREGRPFCALCALVAQNPINEAVAEISAYCFFCFFSRYIFSSLPPTPRFRGLYGEYYYYWVFPDIRTQGLDWALKQRRRAPEFYET